MHNPNYFCIPIHGEVIVYKYDFNISVDKRYEQNYFLINIH